MDLRQTFAANLRRLRHAKGVSQEDLADVNRSYMSRLEKGEPYVGLEIIGKLADALGAEPIEFFQAMPRRAPRKRSR